MSSSTRPLTRATRGLDPRRGRDIDARGRAATASRSAVDARLIAGTGFLGGYTTFSTYAYETFQLVDDGAGASAALNVVASLAAGLAAAVVGLVLAGGW